MRQAVWFSEVYSPVGRGCTTHSRPDSRLRHCHWTVSTFRLRMTSPVIITSRESVTHRQVPGTRSTLPGRTIRTASRGQAPAPGRLVSPPRSWAARPPPLEGARSPRTTSSARTPSALGGDRMSQADRPFQVGNTALEISKYTYSLYDFKWFIW